MKRNYCIKSKIQLAREEENKKQKLCAEFLVYFILFSIVLNVMIYET